MIWAPDNPESEVSKKLTVNLDVLNIKLRLTIKVLRGFNFSLIKNFLFDFERTKALYCMGCNQRISKLYEAFEIKKVVKWLLIVELFYCQFLPNQSLTLL